MTYDPYADARARLSPMVERAARSSKPRVIGILAIVFAGVGLFAALANVGFLFDLYSHRYRGLTEYRTWVWICSAIGLAVSGLHLAGGIQCVRYRRSGPRLLTVYGLLAVALIVLDVIGSIWVLAGSGRSEDIAIPRIMFDVMALPWPIVALVIINTRSARRSCH